MNAKEKILSDAEMLFMRYGVRSVTMDDVAREVSMSKKTLYQYFDNKDKLVTEVAINHLDKERKDFEEIERIAQDSIHEIFLVTHCLRKHIFKMNPSLLYDMKKYHADAWNHYMDFKDSVVKKYIQRNINRGIKEGVFRKEIDAEVIAILRVEQVQLVFDPKLFPPDKYDFTSVQIQVMQQFIYGLFTDAGRTKYQEHLKSETLNYTL